MREIIFIIISFIVGGMFGAAAAEARYEEEDDINHWKGPLT